MIGVGFGAVKALGVAGQFASGLMSSSARQAEFNDQLHQLQLKKNYTVGLASVRAGASGTTMDSANTVNYLAGLTGEFDHELMRLKDAQKTSGIAGLIGNISGLAGGAADIYGGLGQLNDWWR
jgi:hypothetical protein